MLPVIAGEQYWDQVPYAASHPGNHDLGSEWLEHYKKQACRDYNIRQCDALSHGEEGEYYILKIVVPDSSSIDYLFISIEKQAV